MSKWENTAILSVMVFLTVAWVCVCVAIIEHTVGHFFGEWFQVVWTS